MCASDRHESVFELDEHRSEFIDQRKGFGPASPSLVSHGFSLEERFPGVANDDIVRLEPVVSAAVLVATAFRLRDEEGLIQSLRLLVAATETLERDD